LTCGRGAPRVRRRLGEGGTPRIGGCARTLFSLCALALAGCGQHDTAPAGGSAAAPQILRLSQRNEPASLDPATTTLPDEFGILRALLEGLLIPGANGGDPLPGVAQRFDASPNGLVYTFHLRPEARWSDGQPVTAGQFVAAYRRALTPATAAPKASVFFPVKNARAFVTGQLIDFTSVGFRAADPRTLVVTLEQPNPRLPHYVTSGPWLPVPTDVIAKHGRNWTRPEHFVGNGPFLLAEWRADQRIVVKKNPYWHGAASVKLTEIRFERFDNGDSEDRAYRAGQIDATMAIPFSKVPVYARERPAELHRAPMIETRYLAFNTLRPALNREARLALSLALDRLKIVERVLQGGQIAATHFVPPQLAAGTSSSPESTRHDPDEARRLLARAGFPAGRGFPRLELSGWTQSQVLEAIQQMWREKLGIQISIAVREAKVHLDALRTGDFDIAFATSIPDVADPAAMLSDFAGLAPLNYPRWSDPDFDAALVAGRFAAAEERLLESAAVAPLYFNTKIWLMSPRVRGWQEDGLWARCYQGISLDEK
jgi:oligopeptide transport system substrate-binding protein